MEAKENELTPLESLQKITEVINKTKENIKAQSPCYLMWGWLLAIASFSFYFLHSYTTFKYYFLPFPLLVICGIILTAYYYRTRRHAAETYFGHFLKILWLVLGVSFVLVVFINVIEEMPPFTYTLLIAGIGTLVSGSILRFRPLINGGLLFLGFSVASVFVSDIYKPLLQGIAVIGGYLIPGYLLKYSNQ